MNKTNWIQVAALGIIGAIAGFALYQQLNATTTDTAVNAINDAGHYGKRPDFQLQDLEGKLRSISEWDKQVVVLNFWATWCPPCKREIPEFIEMQELYGDKGLQVVGVAIDQLEAVENYSDGMGVNYPVLVGEDDAIEITQKYGNSYGQLPYTVVINRQGDITSLIKGETDRKQLENIVKPFL